MLGLEEWSLVEKVARAMQRPYWKSWGERVWPSRSESGVVRDERGGARKTSSGGLNFHANPVKAREWRAQIPPQRVGCISLAQGSLLMHSGMFYL